MKVYNIIREEMYRFRMRDVNDNETIYEDNLQEGNCYYCNIQTTIPFEVCHTCAIDYLHLTFILYISTAVLHSVAIYGSDVI